MPPTSPSTCLRALRPTYSPPPPPSPPLGWWWAGNKLRRLSASVHTRLANPSMGSSNRSISLAAPLLPTNRRVSNESLSFGPRVFPPKPLATNLLPAPFQHDGFSPSHPVPVPAVPDEARLPIPPLLLFTATRYQGAPLLRPPPVPTKPRLTTCSLLTRRVPREPLCRPWLGRCRPHGWRRLMRGCSWRRCRLDYAVDYYIQQEPALFPLVTVCVSSLHCLANRTHGWSAGSLSVFVLCPLFFFCGSPLTVRSLYTSTAVRTRVGFLTWGGCLTYT